MLCPVCQQEQVIVEFEGVELDLCIDGHGVWFDDQELRMLFESCELPEEVRDLEARLARVDDPAAGAPRRRCPRCSAKMEHVRAPAAPEPVILDRCPRGHGLWFDPGELQQVLAAAATGEHPALDRIHSHLSAFARPSEQEQA